MMISALLALFLLDGSLMEIVFRCPSCTAERQAACPKLTSSCAEIVREPGCGCCPVCARQKGELCGVYTPRCGSGLRCYPSANTDLQLEQLLQGLGRCDIIVDLETTMTTPKLRDCPRLPQGCDVPGHALMQWGCLECRLLVETCDPSEAPSEVNATRPPPQKKPTKDNNYQHIKEIAVKYHLNKQKTKMFSPQDDLRVPHPRQSQCQQELDRVLEEISRMTFHDNIGPLENLYDLNFPNCDITGQYNLKQCHMSTHGQRGECWCVNPHTGIQIPSSPKVRGDPNCSQYFDGPELEPPTNLQK
ncbi:Insulin-like growth factor-binding protein 2-B [Triplophysa tibetana]|uniref:Insulin-like growth factor-binding protein 2-B n=1 Tax=Triplophysa tibetana TaxID=1572043 RepID=A0A5A9P075_9TELE|nr:Insulin-like growth factor-binding protein 2-B [Triplophysa tibetana]